MPRTTRKKSSTGIYHVMLRGNNRQIIFHSDADTSRFLSVLARYRRHSGCKIYAYCIMDNHVHLLIREGHEELGLTFQRIGANYVYWYNQKYQRIGHLFQDRYRSETVEDQRSLLAVMRYIHQNPVKANIVSSADQYAWSSYSEYLHSARLCDTGPVLRLFADDLIHSVQSFIAFHKAENDDQYLEQHEVVKLDDRTALAMVMEITGIRTIEDLASYEKSNRDRLLRQIRDQGLSIRQISRLTGISTSIIKRC